ncbi:hypothetical protein FRC10_004238 [Ceratobasidium sp. 414]|nr:hypothetical protein FRC10_004238 [Ceratobasidium sp. 414]
MPIFLWLYPNWRRARSLVRSYLQDALDSSEKRKDSIADQGSLLTDADCVVDMIVQQERREGADVFDAEEILDELCLYILAGQDTTTATLSWFVKYMPQDLDIQRRLHEEVCASSTDTTSITLEILDDVERMPVLEAVVVETLRFLSYVRISDKPGLIEKVLSDDVVLGRRVPKGKKLNLFPLGNNSNAALGTDMIILAGFVGTSES